MTNQRDREVLMTNHEGGADDAGGGPKRWRKRRRRRGRGGSGGGGGGSSGGGGGGGNGGGGGGGGHLPSGGGNDFVPEVEGELQPLRGLLELQRDMSGWLRQERHMYLPDPDGYDDVFVPISIVRQNRLLEGSHVVGKGGLPVRGHKRPTLVEVDEVDGLSPEASRDRRLFRELTVVDPAPMFVLAHGDDADISLRIVDLLCPIGRGQRGLIVAPPRSGKTVLMQKICHAIADNYPEVCMIVLLIDERPEEATGWKRAVAGVNREVLVSTLDEGPKNHIAVAEMAMRRAQRLVETGKDVVILLDSITRMTRAYNSALGRGGGATMSGGIGAKVIEQPKKFFGSARKCEEGGSLTILATTLVDTGSRMDQVIFEEFKGTGNMELVLNRQLAERRIFPAIDLELSGTRKEELLLSKGVVNSIYTLRRVLARLNVLDAMPMLIDKLSQTKTNAQFLASFRVDE
ncbi:MAG: transcription termination factor Rho [Planctomycetes bacterium]|nr:transcription termination factor Rho [Planctomycetota bacterium]